MLNSHSSLLTFATFDLFAKFVESMNVFSWWAQISLHSEYHTLNESFSNLNLSCLMTKFFVPICLFLFDWFYFVVRWFGHFLIFEGAIIFEVYSNFHLVIHSFWLSFHYFIFASITLILTFAMLFGFNGISQNQFSFGSQFTCSIFVLIFIFHHSNSMKLQVSHKYQHITLSLF